MSSISWKMGEKAVISEERVARSLYYYAKFTGDIRACYAYTKRIDFLFFCGFSKNQRLLELV